MNLLGKDKSFNNSKFDKAFGKVLPLATATKADKRELEKAVQDAVNSL